MHAAAANCIKNTKNFLRIHEAGFVDVDNWNVIEVGSRDINGRASTFWGAHASWHGIDIADGPNVDEVGDAAEVLKRHAGYDLAICCEVFEHAENWREILAEMHQVAGVVLITCAGEGRAPHSAIDGGRVRPGEYYANITQTEMEKALADLGMIVLKIQHSQRDGDLYVLAM
jgi:hypothetical protein